MEEQKQIRCAIYTRKSTDEGLEKEFNTLEAQREAGENFVMSMKHQGWVILPDHYDDGGFSGGNLKRPALKRLMADVEKGKVDMIVVYKIDRLTRSLLDFAQLPPFFVIIVRLPLFLTLHPISAPFRPVPAGKLPPVSCPPVPGQWPV